MGEILQIQVGQCGNRVGNNFWENIFDEHGIDELGRFSGYSAETQLERINVYFNETPNRVYVPRAVLVDLASSSAAAANGRFRRENFVRGVGVGGTGRNWARGYRAAGGDSVAEAIRSEAERCDRLQGFQIVHSLSGGTGSGLGARVVDHARDQYPNRTVNTFSVVPAMETVTANGTAAETYNAALCVARLIGGANNTYLADNGTLRDACAGPLRMPAPAYADLNHLVSRAMSDVTAGLRFGGTDECTTMKKCTANLVPYRRLHFFAPAVAPLTYRGQVMAEQQRRDGGEGAAAMTVPQLTGRLFAAVAACGHGRPPRPDDVVMAAVVAFRGRQLCAADVDAGRVAAAAGPTARFLLPDNVKTVGCAVPARGLAVSGTVVANTTAVCAVFDGIRRRHTVALSRRELVHAFESEGTTVDDLRDAGERIDALAEEYRSVRRLANDDDD